MLYFILNNVWLYVCMVRCVSSFIFMVFSTCISENQFITFTWLGMYTKIYWKTTSKTQDTKYLRLKVLTTMISNNLSRDTFRSFPVYVKTSPKIFLIDDILTTCATAQNILDSLFLKNYLFHWKVENNVDVQVT